jgi:putative ABC transport system ATP-binding protein
LKKHYDMGEVMIAALRGIDPDLYAGEFLVLLGPSDSGKSTLLNILGAFDAPSNGILSYEGDDLSIYSDAALTRYRCKPVSFVFQFYTLIRALTARENVVLVTEIAAAPRDGIGGHGRASKPVPRPDVGRGTAHGCHSASHCEEASRAAT